MVSIPGPAHGSFRDFVIAQGVTDHDILLLVENMISGADQIGNRSVNKDLTLA